MTTLIGKRVLVFGLGLHGGGVAVVRWLTRQGARVTVTDLRSSSTLAPSLTQLADLRVTYVLGKHRKRDITNADTIIKNPGVPVSSPYLVFARTKGIPVHTDIELFLERCKGNVYAVTGTKGKTTTATLLWRMLKVRWPRVQLAGNTGVSPLTLLTSAHVKHPVVLELSSWQLEDLERVRWHPTVGIFTNIYPDHLDRHGTMHKYIEAKMNLFRSQLQSDIAVLNHDNAYVRRISMHIRSHKVWFSARLLPPARPGVGVHDGSTYFYYPVGGAKKKKLFSLADIAVHGLHNTENVLAASAAAYSAGVSPQGIRRTVRTFVGVPQRYELVKIVRKIRFVNDTTATTPEAACAALATTPVPIVLIAGGADKKLQYTKFVRAIHKTVSVLVVLPGNASMKILSKINRRRVVVVKAASMRAAVRAAYRYAQPGTTVLLSPGCASFGLFTHEFDRGEQFVREVRSLR